MQLESEASREPIIGASIEAVSQAIMGAASLRGLR
jgi:hypothetical protein